MLNYFDLDPDPYLRLMDSEPGGPKQTCESGESGTLLTCMSNIQLR
jgi:hypothetical protein